MILTQERAILKGEAKFQQIVAFVRQASRDGHPIDQVERELWGYLLKIGHTMLEAYVLGQGTGDLGENLVVEGRTLHRLEQTHDRRYVSMFGELTIRRHVYGTRETQKHELVPLDARLNLPAGEFSYMLQEWDQAACVKNSYAESRAGIQQILGLKQSVRALEQMSTEMAQSVEAFRVQQPAPPAEEEGPILVLTADGKGVPMRRNPDEPRVEGRRGKGQKANKKRMATVGSVYTIQPFRRTAEEVVDEVVRKKAQEKRPAPQHKEIRAELTRQIDGQEVNGKDRIFAWFGEQARVRNAGGRKLMVCLMDGERALWKKLGQFFVGIVCILDLYHMMERLWQAAHCFYAEGSDEAKAFVSERLTRILQGQAGRVIGGIRQMAVKRGLRGSKLRQLHAATNYLHNNRRFMHYDQYLAAGYPIGSGVAEGTCRHLVKDRMEQTGMRWRTPGAQAILDLRAVYLSEEWDAFNAYRIDRESRRLYPNRETLQKQWDALAA